MFFIYWHPFQKAQRGNNIGYNLLRTQCFKNAQKVSKSVFCLKRVKNLPSSQSGANSHSFLENNFGQYLYIAQRMDFFVMINVSGHLIFSEMSSQRRAQRHLLQIETALIKKIKVALRTFPIKIKSGQTLKIYRWIFHARINS